jgi:carbon storage regulator
MLVLTRKIGQKIILLNGTIEMIVLHAKGETVRIGIQAPLHIDVDREEIYLKKLFEQRVDANQAVPS